ncbi:hypothetical protein C1H46_015964 [Malus baccata]|uniref:GTP-binding protein ERG n=1 Tax=Malus baccata TaxID=106549 RepID=A0A540MI01_MALBA|nr:hypothetical protein C1H46_015964 [Malus baccata]
MKALRVLRTLSSKPSKTPLNPASFFHRFYAAQPQEDDSGHNPPFSDSENGSDSVFDSTHYAIPSIGSDSKPETPRKPTWDNKYRSKANKLIGVDTHKEKLRRLEEEEEQKSRVLAKALLEAALERADDEESGEEEMVKEDDQKALSVGIIGAPNAGKSALTNYMVGTKVSAVSRKTNTTTHEVLGVMTKGDTQICFFDTPGLTLSNKGCPYKDFKVRVESAWSSVTLYNVLIVIFDVHRHLTRPDVRVIGLIKRMGALPHPVQKRILCMNKVDLVEKKKDLLKVAEEFKDLPGYERHFMISGLKGSGVKDLTQYLMDQAYVCFGWKEFFKICLVYMNLIIFLANVTAVHYILSSSVVFVKRSWDEDPLIMTEEVMKNISLEVVRERLLDHVHQEIPYTIEHRLMDWKELRDGSLRIEQHLITNKLSQRKILVGKKGNKIGRIGMEANEELRSIFKRDVHLILQVGTKVSAVSRKTNTTTHEVLGVMTKGDTQICFFDTPGLTLSNKGCPYKDFKVRVESAWSSVTLYNVLIVIFDVHRHLTRPDVRVIGLIKRMGALPHPVQKRILCMNKVDLVEKKKDLLKVAEEFKDLPGYERHFMISGLKGSGVKDLTQYLMDQAYVCFGWKEFFKICLVYMNLIIFLANVTAVHYILSSSVVFVKRSWDEDPLIMTEEVMKNISLEVVRERLLDHVHQEIPYTIEHRLMDWKELRDGSLRIEQHLITNKLSQRKILVGKKGNKIGRIGMEANEELRSIFKRDVHLILQLKQQLKNGKNMIDLGNGTNFILVVIPSRKEKL